MKFKDLREDRDIKQEQIANLLHVKQPQVSRIESGKNQLDYDGLIKLALFYNTSIDYMLGLTEEDKPYPRTKKKSL